MSEDIPGMEVIENEKCPMCGEKKLTLTEMERDVPFFGQLAIFSMDCNACGYHKADVEALEEHDPVKFTIEISCEEDLKIRVIKSSYANIKIGTIATIEAGEASNGYITNVEGILNRIKRQIEFLRDNSDDPADTKKAKNHLKKLTRVLWGQEKIKIVLEDPTGNSSIISDKAVKDKLKVKK
jgi:zinc finger protein